MNEQLESESLVILAGMNEQDNSFELDQYFQQMLSELQIKLPTKMEAANILLNYFMTQMVAEPTRAYELMTAIQNNVYYAIKWPESNSENQYMGHELGLEKLYTWYRELQDFNAGSMLLYYNELPRHKQKMKFEEHLVKEAQNWLNAGKTYT
ncbi:hypothetical protein [Marinoscillum furvescens]|nr:hypothetical protein [Marinoscillum furvescens]